MMTTTTTTTQTRGVPRTQSRLLRSSRLLRYGDALGALAALMLALALLGADPGGDALADITARLDHATVVSQRSGAAR